MKRTKILLSDSLLTHTDHLWIEREGQAIRIPMKELRVGDPVILRTGAVIPIDGAVIRGEAVVNQAVMTGEAVGVFKKEGDTVFAGTLVEDGSMVVAVRTLENDTRISKIVDMISESEKAKAQVQYRAERLADRIVPFSFLLSAGLFAFTGDLTKALSVLLVDYSCAIKLSTPLAIISAMREAAERAVVVKGGKFFEAMARADVVVFDKTGTLTVADPAVRKVVVTGDLSRAEVLRLAACIEEHFPHSVARAIVRAAQEEALHHEEEHTEVEYIVAHGIATSIRGRRAIIGSRHFVFDDEKTPLDERSREIIEREIGGDSAVFLAVDGRLAGFICVGDPPRPDAARAISGLRALGIQEIIMLTGDNHSAAKRIADQLGIDRFFAQVLPKDKVSIIEALKKEGKNIMMVGDGVNDSPALAAADVSVSMKDSSDIAREVADVTLLSSDLTQLVSAIKLSRGLMERIRGNFRLIIAFNTALLLLGIADIITPTASALLHNAATLGISAAGMRPCLPGPGAGEED